MRKGQNRPRLPSYAHFAEPYTPALAGRAQAPGRGGASRCAAHAHFEDGWSRGSSGHGNVPANRNVLVVANHASHVDFALVSYALGPMGGELVVLAANDYFFNTNDPPLRRPATSPR